MADYEIMAHQISLPIAPEDPLALPAGWEPIGTLARQGNNAVVLCRRVAGPPAGGPPQISSITPNTLPAGSTPASIDVLGLGFDGNCTVYADSAPRSTFFIDASHLQYTSRPDLQAGPATVQITVEGANGTSNAVPFTFT